MNRTFDERSLVARIAAWCEDPAAAQFPLQPVLDELLARGQHFIEDDVLAALDLARRAARRAAGPLLDVQILQAFLETVLDKYDGRYEYATYLALPLFEIASPRGAGHREVRDRWVALLIADALRFERDCNDGARGALPELRPDPELVRKRVLLAARALAPLAARLGLPAADVERDVAAAVFAAAPASQVGALAPAMQPVYVMHDEHLFIRVLQSIEATFTGMRGLAEDALAALRRFDAGEAVAALASCAEMMDESQILFSLLATMRSEAFRSFRRYTEGASAIQSVNYKTFESLCGTPPARRLDSSAFVAVPGVRERVLAGADNIAAAFDDARAAGRSSEADEIAVLDAMRRLEDVHDRWKQTHYKIAMRMIGPATGTGYTAGTPYLREVLDNRLFPGSPAPQSEIAS